MSEHARCSVCGKDPELLTWPGGYVKAACATSLCVTGPLRTSVEDAWDAWDTLHGPRIPDEVKEIVLSAWALLGEDADEERWCHATLKEAVEACPSVILLACGCVAGGPTEDEEP